MISDGGNSAPFCVARLNSDGASKSCEYFVEVGARARASRVSQVVSRFCVCCVARRAAWIVVRVTHTGTVVPMVLGSAQCLFTNATRFAFSYLVFGRLRAHPCVHVKSSLCAEQFQALQATCPLQREQTEPFPLAPGPRWALMEALVNYAARGPVVGPVRVRIIGDSMLRQTFWELVYLLRGESVFVDIYTFDPISYVQVVLTDDRWLMLLLRIRVRVSEP